MQPALTEKESIELFKEIHRLKEEDKIIFIVTHRLKEIVPHADRVVVIRDGETAAIFEKHLISEERLARSLVVGKKRSSFIKKNSNRSAREDCYHDSDLIFNGTHWIGSR